MGKWGSHNIIVMAIVAAGGLMAGCDKQSSPDSTFEIRFSLNSIMVPHGQDMVASAPCNADERVLSGGFSLVGPEPDRTVPSDHPPNQLLVLGSYPTTDHWNAWVVNDTGSPANLQVHVLCYRNNVSGFNITTVTAAGLTNNQSISAQCPTSTQITAAGFKVSPTVSLGSRINTRNAFLVRSFNPVLPGHKVNVILEAAQGSTLHAQPAAVTAYAQCLEDSLVQIFDGPVSNVSAAPAPDRATTTVSGVLSCPAGGLLAGAGMGVSATARTTYPYAFAPNVSTWDYGMAAFAHGGDLATNPGGGVSLKPLCVKSN